MDALMQLGTPWLVGMAFVAGAVPAGVGAWWARRREAARVRAEAQRLKKSLRTTQVQLDQARKNVEALQEEVLGWRRRSAMSSQVRSAARALPPVPSPQAEDWVIAALLDGDGARSRRESFADTQVLMAAH